jgi:hypothetical protein
MAGLLRRDAACARLLLLALLLLCLVACAESGALGAILREKVSEKSDSLAAWFDAKFGHLSKDPRHQEGIRSAALMTVLLFLMFVPQWCGPAAASQPP